MNTNKLLLLCAFCCLAVFVAVAIALLVRLSIQNSSLERTLDVSGTNKSQGKTLMD
ncbi:hypothetical protein [Neorickettsia findlayensis]|uniref:Uncharacterized protein n=1 Tax=Neorickettsia findlayensis TaxID=2686014 RepID=A0A6P1G9M1_9RICK|nr:hypothetical protein [Neorickettsia findlayensis]QHD64933.1 hypothetical protein GP480_00385 [Neorickettsia findlayensis]